MKPDLAALLSAPGPRSLRDVPLPAGTRVPMLGPHPDDFDAGAAA